MQEKKFILRVTFYGVKCVANEWTYCESTADDPQFQEKMKKVNS